ncbi:MAG: hypothetical protein FWC46_00530 [Actinomycetia bacterium]|nr:hypothetical protein [Actinomycetes bacterium]
MSVMTVAPDAGPRGHAGRAWAGPGPARAAVRGAATDQGARAHRRRHRVPRAAVAERAGSIAVHEAPARILAQAGVLLAFALLGMVAIVAVAGLALRVVAGG